MGVEGDRNVSEMARISPSLKFNSRQLRSNMTDAEQHLWRYLRMRQMSGFMFRRQHPVCGYILDFACVDIKLAVELDGGQHADNIEGDEIRTKALNQGGWIVIRFWINDVLINIQAVLSAIHKQISEIQPPSQPSP